MSSPAGDGEVRITIKDLFMAQKQYEDKLVQSDKKLGEALSDLRITLIGISTHLQGLDQRNAAADELHREHGRRLSEVERIIDVSGVRTMREERDVIVKDIYDKIAILDKDTASKKAVEEAQHSAKQAGSNARLAFWGMVAAIVAALGLAVALLAHINVH